MSLDDLADYLKSAENKCEEFKIEPFYNLETDSIVCYTRDVPSYEKWLTPKVSVFLSTEDDSFVGFEINGVKHLVK